MRSFITLTLFTALAASAPLAHGPYSLKSRHSASSPLAGRAVGIDGTCGPIWGGVTCAPGLCCSAEGNCGTSDAYCGVGCQSPFGDCGSNSGTGSAPVATTPAAPSVPVVSSPAVVSSSPVAAPTSSFVSVPSPVTVAAPPAASSAVVTSAAPIVAPTSSVAPVAPVQSAPVPNSPTSNSNSGGSGTNKGRGDTYTMYNGDGSTSEGWPSQSDWVDFETMWTANMQYISISCEDTWFVPNNSDEESADLKSAIQNMAQSSGIDERFILAIVMQESKGCVRVPTTSWSVLNPGLMQSFKGTGSCNSGGSVQNPCPQSEINQMIHDGTMGTPDMGLNQMLQKAATSTVAQYYIAARLYNSGPNSGVTNLGASGSTPCYSSDIANRLTGWVTAASQCDLKN